VAGRARRNRIRSVDASGAGDAARLDIAAAVAAGAPADDAPGPRCSSRAPFERILPLTISNDIYVATRAAVTEDFGNPVPVTTLTGDLHISGLEASSWISEDNCRLYFTRAPTAALLYDAFFVERTPDPVVSRR
jgi:hypothetical protein